MQFWKRVLETSRKFLGKPPRVMPEPDPLQEMWDILNGPGLPDVKVIEAAHWKQVNAPPPGYYQWPDVNAQRTVTYIGRDPSRVRVAGNQTIMIEAFIITPDDTAYFVKTTLPAGKEWSLELELKHLASGIIEQGVDKAEGSELLANATIEANYYLGTYSQIRPTTGAVA